MTTYFVSSEIGSDHNAGTSATSALATLQAAEALVKPGDTVEVMNGTYTGPGYGNVLTITTSGTASAPITFEAAPGATPVIDSSGCWQGILIQASYIVINGFTVVGDAANYTLSQAIAGYSPGNANLDGNGIGVNSPDGKFVPNHITIENNTVYNEPGGGIYTMGADYVQILNNVVHDNTHWSVYGNSGISIATSANSDTNSGVHDIISGNVSYNNQNLVQENYSGVIMDGEGIILDTNPGFVGEILVQGNTTYGNSGPGIESFLTDNVVITNNTTHGDLQNATLASQGGRTEIWINLSNNNTVTNNNTLNSAPLPLTPLILSFSPDTGVADRITDANILTLTGTAATNDTVTVTDGSTTIGTTTSNASGQWTLTTAALANGIHRFTATTTDGGTSAALAVTIDMHVPAAPVVSSFSPNTGGIDTTNQLTLTGTAEANSTVTVFYGSTALGTAVANASGAWTYPSGILPNGVYTFTATATDGAGVTGPASAPLSVTVNAPVTTNLVANGAFEAGNLTGWTMGGNDGLFLGGPQIFITNTAQSGQFAADLGSVGSDGTLSQNILTTAGQNYTVQFWLANASGGPNDFTAKWNGQTLLALTNAAAQGYTEYTYNVVATAGISNLEFDARQDPSDWRLDSISVTAVGSQPSAPPPSTPVPPVIASFSPDTGVAGDHITDANKLALTGTAAASSTVSIYDGSALLGTTTANSSGAWNYPTAMLANGAHSFTATDTVSGATSTASAALAVTIDTHVPAAPVVSSFSPNTGGIDTTNQLTLTGTAEANSTVTVFDGSATLGTAVANASGAWTYPSGILPNGVHTFTATATDVAGMAGPASAPLSVTVNAPVTTNLVANGAFEAGNLTGWTMGGNDGLFLGGPQIFITNTAQSGQFAADLGSVGSDGTLSQNILTTAGQSYTVQFWLANASGGPNDFTAKWNGQTLLALTNAAAQGYTEYTYNVVATAGISNLEFDARQDPSDWRLDSISVTAVGSQPSAPPPSTPVPPVIASFSPDTGVVGDGITDPAVLTLTGTALAGSTVTVFDGTQQLGTAPVSATGTWSYTTSALPDGNHTLTATDTNAGQTSAPSSALSVTIDTVAPAQPKISSFSPDTTPTADGHTTATTIALSGTGEANSTITVFDGTRSLGPAPVNSSGAWSIAASNLVVGSHNFTATDTDAAGNTSVASAPLAVTIDAFSSPTPPAPVIASFSHDSGVKGDGITNDKTLSLTGTAGANDTVNVFDGTTLLGTAPVNSSGNWSYTTLALPDGRHSFTSTDTNAAGNTSAPSSALVVTVDTVAPARPTVSSFSPDTAPTGDGQTTATNLTLTGMGEASSTIQVFDGTSLLGTAPVNAVGNWSTAANNLAVGSHSFSATDADAAGNTSVASVQLAVTILSQPWRTNRTRGSSGGGTTVSPPPSAAPDPVTVANPFGLAHA